MMADVRVGFRQLVGAKNVLDQRMVDGIDRIAPHRDFSDVIANVIVQMTKTQCRLPPGPLRRTFWTFSKSEVDW